MRFKQSRPLSVEIQHFSRWSRPGDLRINLIEGACASPDPQIRASAYHGDAGWEPMLTEQQPENKTALTKTTDQRTCLSECVHPSTQRFRTNNKSLSPPSSGLNRNPPPGPRQPAQQSQICCLSAVKGQHANGPVDREPKIVGQLSPPHGESELPVSARTDHHQQSISL